jgi:hypothetical protein
LLVSNISVQELTGKSNGRESWRPKSSNATAVQGGKPMFSFACFHFGTTGDNSTQEPDNEYLRVPI